MTRDIEICSTQREILARQPFPFLFSFGHRKRSTFYYTRVDALHGFQIQSEILEEDHSGVEDQPAGSLRMSDTQRMSAAECNSLSCSLKGQVGLVYRVKEGK